VIFGVDQDDCLSPHFSAKKGWLTAGAWTRVCHSVCSEPRLAWLGRSEPSFHSTTMFFAKATLFFVVATLAAVFCAQSVEAARGPKITSKIYFDIKHGDKDLGRSA
jgi:hypothetical protein